MSDLIDFLRPPVGRCLGAVFLSYDFDEAFFESVLAALLPIHADPDTDPDRFVDEGRRRLRETPVTVLIDGYRARGGHRLPFDLLAAKPSIAFHPKLSLTLFEQHARLMIGSANLTEGGYSGNAELVAQCELSYTKDAAMIHDLRACLIACGAKGEAWSRIEAQLDLLVAPSKPTPAGKTRLLHSASGKSVMQQLLDLLPKKSKVVGVSLFLGVQSEDDPVVETQVLDHFLDALAKRDKKLPPFELALPWEGNPVSAPPEVSEQAVSGQLCARLDPSEDTISYVVPERIEDGMWPVPEIVAIGPVASLERLIERVPVTFHVFPELHLEKGQVYRKGLHAKLIAVRTLQGKHKQTHLLIGAPNFERFAEESNTVVEAALYDVKEGHHGVADLSTELVPAPVEQLYLQNRPLPAPSPLQTSPMEEAIYDASTRTLVLTFRPGTKQAHVFYQTRDQELQLLTGEPRLREQLAEFPLDRHSAEVRVDVGEDSWLVPITFKNTAELSCDESTLESGGLLHFWDFVDLLCGRQTSRETLNEGDLPDERKAPHRVFRAIATLVSELSSTGNALGAFEVAYRGPTGLARFVQCWQTDSIDPSEAWLYGQELARSLSAIRFGKSPAGRYKARVLQTFLDELEQKLAERMPRTVKALDRFYRERA